MKLKYGLAYHDEAYLIYALMNAMTMTIKYHY